MGTLYIVATPIGNLEDITLRAISTLRAVDGVLAEDTRMAKKLLTHFEIQKPVYRYDEHVAKGMHERVLGLIKEGKDLALVTDAGTPAVADPGSRLVSYVRSAAPEIRIVPIPGPSAVITALSAAGISAEQFTFMGYPPHKKGRKTFFEEVGVCKIRPIVLYESPHRLQKTFKELEGVLGIEAKIIVAKELTKIFEELKEDTLPEMRSYFVGAKGKGEFVIIIP